MAKKKSHSKVTKYQHFKLHGHYQPQELVVYIVLDLVISIAVGFFLQGQISQALAMH
jgi:hypothetical protein